MSETGMERADVVVIGAGPSGLAAAESLARHGASVVVLDRESEPGGIPRHSDHPGYGLRDLRRALSGPAYARAWTDRAVAAGADVRTSSTVTGWDAQRVVTVTAPTGRYALAAGAIVVATGCRERPRPARLVAGDRPPGVLTTGLLQQLVHLQHRRAGEAGIGRRAVVVGAEHVSYSAVVTLAEAGVRTVAMVTDQPTHTSYGAFDLAARARWRFPLLTDTRVVALHGRDRLRAVEVGHLGDGRRGWIEADTVVFTGDWIADHELARRHGLGVDSASSGVAVDAGLRTTAPGVFAVGNVVHPAETADVCALDGRHVATAVERWLEGPLWPAAGAPVVVEPPLLWVAPSRLTETSPPARGRLLLRTSRAARLPQLTVRQGDLTLWQGRVAHAVPSRPLSIPTRRWLRAVDLSPAAAPLTISCAMSH
jgi:thioredoxin reductase